MMKNKNDKFSVKFCAYVPKYLKNRNTNRKEQESMFKIAVCDDEKYFLNYIKGILTDYRNEKGVSYEIDMFGSGKEIVALGTGIERYKIVFLDINMNGLDGIITAQKIREINKDIFLVFITAFVKYSLQGYKVDATRYILKDNETLCSCVYECMDAVFEKMNYKVFWKDFDFTGGHKKIPLDRILYIESRLHKLEFHVVQEAFDQYAMYGTLNNLERELAGTGFLRIHQSYLVNMKHIAIICRYRAILDDGSVLEIPRARYRFAEETFCAYKGEI